MTTEIEIIGQGEDAERGLIGSLLYADESMLAEVRLLVGKSDFLYTPNGIIFDAICAILDSGETPRVVDAVTVRNELMRRQVYEDIGGAAYLGKTLLSQPGTQFAGHYAGIVREHSLRRQVLEFAEKLKRRALMPATENNSAEIMQEAMVQLGRLVTNGQPEEQCTLAEALQSVRAQIHSGGVEMVPTGFRDLDTAIGGVGIGEMVVLGARPSMGKSTALRQWAVQAARAGYPVGFISLEEGKAKIGRNLLAAEAGIENRKIRNGSLTHEEWTGLDDSIERLSGLPVYLTDSTRRMGDIRAKATVWKARHGIKLLLIDYLTRVRGVPGGNRYEIASNTSTELSDLLKELQLAGVVAAQLNRGVEGRDEKRPGMSDIRESGQIEQDADGIIFIHREDAYHIGDVNYQPTRTAEFIIAKWRDSERGVVVKMHADLKYQRFNPLGHNEDPVDDDLVQRAEGYYQ